MSNNSPDLTHQILIKRYQSILNKTKMFDESIADDVRKNISFNAIFNFVIHFDGIKSNYEKRNVLNILDLYFNFIESNFISSDFYSRSYVIKNFIKPLAFYYKKDLNFKFYMPLGRTIFLGVNLDLVLLIFGFLKQIHYVPICTLVLFIYFLYIKVFFQLKKKVY